MVFWKYAVNLQENIHVEVQNHNSAWMFSCIFAAYFQKIFSWEHLWRAAPAKRCEMVSLSREMVSLCKYLFDTVKDGAR